MSIAIIVLLLALGIYSGLTAGLLGVGGGMVLVPFLTEIFSHFDNVPKHYVLHIAIATAMGVILFTSMSSMISHHKKGGVRWDIFIKFVPGIFIGGFLSGGVIFKLIHISWLALFFSFFVGYSGYRMLRKEDDETTSGALPAWYKISGMGVVVGLISGLLGAGGGFLTVPFLVRGNLPIRIAVGTSAACTFPIALSNTLGYIYSGRTEIGDVHGFIGFVYWPALLALISMSVLFAPVGAKLAHSISVHSLKRVFAYTLFLIASLMLRKSLIEFGII